MTDAFHQVNATAKEHICHLDYTVKDELASKQLGVISGSQSLQEVNYTYLNNGFLSSINETMSDDDLFKLDLFYDNSDDQTYSPNQKNGNIAQLSWQVKGKTENAYHYRYDYLDRLKFAIYKESDIPYNPIDGGKYDAEYNYDARGNITRLSRFGVYFDGSTFKHTVVDDLTYNYGGGTTNQLQSVSDGSVPPNSNVTITQNNNQDQVAAINNIEASTPVDGNQPTTYQAGNKITLLPGFKYEPVATNRFKGVINTNPIPESEFGGVAGSLTTYQYDSNGNLNRKMNDDEDVADLNIAYNYLNLPTNISIGNVITENGNTRYFPKGNIAYNYTANGTKISKEISNPVLPDLREIKYYVDGIEYLYDLRFVIGNNVDRFKLEAIYHAEGRVVPKDQLEYQYYLADHLGNNRVLFSDTNNDGTPEIIQENHYYPFGLSMQGNFVQNTGREDRYKFNGIEEVSDFGLSVYTAKYRTYDPAIGQWWQIDPDAEMFQSLTPYNNNFNNPIRFNDPDGDNPIKLLKAAYNVGKRAYKTYRKTGKLNARSIGNAAKDELFSIVDNVSTITDSESSTGDKILAVFDLATGFGDEAKVVGASLGLFKKGKIPKPPRGKGAVPPSERDPKRVWSKKEKEEMLTDQDGRCAQCGEEKSVDEVAGHHIERHADGGRTDKDNGAAVCHDCHKKLHSKNEK